MKASLLSAAFPRRRFFISAFMLIWSLYCSSSSTAETVTDDVGRKVDLPGNPKRIVSLAPSVTEILFALDLEERVVGVTLFSNYPAGTSTKEKIGTYIRPNIEKIVSLNPDLIIATAGGNPERVVNQLDGLGLTVFTIFPKEIEDIYKSIRTIGDITGSGEKAESLALELEMDIGEIKDRVGRLKKKKVFFQLGTTPLHTVGSSTFVDRLITMAGGINIAGREKTRYPVYSMEAVIMGKPDVILSAVMGMDKEGTEEFWDRWPSIPAVRNNRIYVVNPDITNRPSPRMAKGLREIAERIHPEVFKGVKTK